MDEQAETAARLGYDDVRQMNREHDLLHLDLCGWLSVPSYSIQEAAGRALDRREKRLADLEESAVMAVDALRMAHGAPLPRDPH